MITCRNSNTFFLRNKNPLKELFRNKKFRTEEEIVRIANQMLVPKQDIRKMELRVNTTQIFDMPKVENHRQRLSIVVPLMLLVDYEDFTTNTGVQSEILKKINGDLSIEEIQYAFAFGEILKDPLLSKKARCFILSHEVAHIALKHTECNYWLSNADSRRHEKEADLLAARKVPGAMEGGIYLFQTLERIFPSSVAATHPSHEERIAYLQKLNLQHKKSCFQMKI